MEIYCYMIQDKNIEIIELLYKYLKMVNVKESCPIFMRIANIAAAYALNYLD